MEFYPHQQQQQQSTTQQVDSMATGSSVSASSTTANNNSTISVNSNNHNNNNNNSNIDPPTTSTTTTADAATVAIAKDMLQLHHGGAHNNNNAVADGINSSNPALASSSSSSSSPAAAAPHPVGIATIITNNPPAHAAAGAPPPPDNALGYLKYENELLYITDPCTIIGRNSSTSHVHFHVAENNLVSRKHFQVLCDADSRDFYVQCLSKNGIFVNEFLQRRNADPMKLEQNCFFRFPSTEIRINFESFLMGSGISNSGGEGSGAANVALGGTSSGTLNNNHQRNAMHNNNSSTGITAPTASSNSIIGSGAHVIISPAPPDDHQQQHHHHSHHHTTSGSSQIMPMDTTNVIYAPLKISIPKKEQKSPYLSPTGTISAANSCPASPRQGYHQNQASYNSYGNNNLQNQDLFQTPSTASYNHNEKPPYSYAQLIVQAISAAPDKQLTLSGIYSFIVKHYPYYRKETNKGWQNSIRHNLSLNRYFIKVARSQDEPGKGSFWRIDPDSGSKLIDHSYKKRRQRSSQGFRPSYGMPRSAPVSPSHMDNSRESSPLQDIVLQSAPGSPGMSMENRAAEVDLMYSSQNLHQTSANNSHNQYNSGSPYYISNQNSVIGLTGGGQQQSHSEGGNAGGVGALIALKRNQTIAAGAAAATAAAIGHQQHQQQQNLHPDIIFEEMPTDYSGNMESGDEIETSVAKRSKYVSEVL